MNIINSIFESMRIFTLQHLVIARIICITILLVELLVIIWRERINGITFLIFIVVDMFILMFIDPFLDPDFRGFGTVLVFFYCTIFILPIEIFNFIWYVIFSILEFNRERKRMDKCNVLKTQEIWKDYPNTEYWLKVINEPQAHMIVADNKIIGVDSDYLKAVESLNYILTGQIKIVTL